MESNRKFLFVISIKSIMNNDEIYDLNDKSQFTVPLIIKLSFWKIKSLKMIYNMLIYKT